MCVSVFVTRAGVGMDTSCDFLWGVLAVIPLIGSVVCVGVFRDCAGCEVGPHGSIGVTLLSRVESVPQLLD